MSPTIRRILYVAGCVVLPIAWGLMVEAVTHALSERSRNRTAARKHRKGER